MGNFVRWLLPATVGLHTDKFINHRLNPCCPWQLFKYHSFSSFFNLHHTQALVARTTPLFLTFCLQIYFQKKFFISLLFHLFFLILTCSCQYSYNLMLTYLMSTLATSACDITWSRCDHTGIVRLTSINLQKKFIKN